ncbi:TRAP transporter small permease subunit [Mameliella sediminis]|uniref:TRAP transporter small permease subunit n=1 Tax=Mameliella sediminis TaxID=2836866 RepID=UPI001C480EB8|nr:TRAP transporter small permease subunit [Mameliella sediminis]MBY6116766.1 TRAP transporter small permease subunit [Antarctobacter heliothermus]MBY6146519.1 TRAP transporter small permease subunit [Mameliella alba]MBV7396421.1 TRAP transporter small permease subunit [Mameliella sediminis]MBY6162748.1 TRAP transporter small permease subunit [Mameliella alba]MBY6171011.1 TRAP transporter small permease subunit [Mameliella alba]
MTRLLDILDRISRLTAILSVLLVFGIAVLIIAEVVSRWAFNHSLSFAWEYSAYFFAVAVFCGAAYTLRTGGHVRVALLRGLLGPRGQHWMEIFATLIGVGITLFAANAMVAFAWRSFQRGSVSPTVDATPLAIPQGAIAFGLVLLALQMIARLLRLFLNEPPEDEDALESFGAE